MILARFPGLRGDQVSGAGQWDGSAAAVRIAVCRPQVPFVYGGAEVVADPASPTNSRLRGHEESSSSSMPFKYGTRSRHARPRPARSSGGSLDVDRRLRRRPTDRARDRDEVPSPTSHPPPRTRSSGSCTSSGRPTTTTAPSTGQFSDSPEDRATRLGDRALRTPSRSREARHASSPSPAERRRPAWGALLAASTPQVLPPPPTEAGLTAGHRRATSPRASCSRSTASTAPSQHRLCLIVRRPRS